MIFFGRRESDVNINFLFLQSAAAFSIGIALVDVHVNWLNWFHFLILEGALLVILTDDMIFLSLLLNVKRMYCFIQALLPTFVLYEGLSFMAVGHNPTCVHVAPCSWGFIWSALTGVEITICSGVRHFCRNFLNFVFKNISFNNVAQCGKLIFTCPFAHVQESLGMHRAKYIF